MKAVQFKISHFFTPIRRKGLDVNHKSVNMQRGCDS